MMGGPSFERGAAFLGNSISGSSVTLMHAIITDVTGHFDFDLKIEWSGRLLHLFASSREKIIGGWEGGAHLSGTLPRITSLK